MINMLNIGYDDDTGHDYMNEMGYIGHNTDNQDDCDDDSHLEGCPDVLRWVV